MEQKQPLWSVMLFNPSYNPTTEELQNEILLLNGALGQLDVEYGGHDGDIDSICEELDFYHELFEQKGV